MSNQDRAEGILVLRSDAECLVRDHERYATNETSTVGGRLAAQRIRAALATPQAPGADTPGGRGEAVVWVDPYELMMVREHGGMIVATGEAEPESKRTQPLFMHRQNPAESSGGDAVDLNVFRRAVERAIAHIHYKWAAGRLGDADYHAERAEYERLRDMIDSAPKTPRGEITIADFYAEYTRGRKDGWEAAIASGAEHGR